MQVEYIDHMGDDKSVVNAARVSFAKIADNYTDEQNDKLINYLAKHNHWTPFAHTAISLRITAPISIRTQCFKHKAGFVENECFSDDTEVLTDTGWKYWADVTDQDLLATPNPDFTWYEFKKPLRLIEKDYSGVLYHCTSRDLDMLCTPNHEHPISHYVTTGGKYWTDYDKRRTVDLNEVKFPKLPAVPPLYSPQGSDYWAGFFEGVFLGDGSLSNDGKRIYFHVKKERKKEMLRELIKNTPELCWNENAQPDGYSYFRCYNIYGFSGKTTNKAISWLSDTEQYFNGLFDGLIATDGHKTAKNSTTFSTVSANLYKDLLKLCDKLGRDTTTHTRPKVGNWNKAFKVTVKVSRPKLIRNIDLVPYTGKVYCAETETGYLIVRRNGKSNVTGNCSRRYVTDIPEYYLPVFRSKPDGSIKQGSGDELSEYDQTYWKRLYVEHQCKSIALYDRMIKDGIAPEQARFVLPQGVETQWVWTGNLASFARFYKQRTDPHAQKEIQELAEMVGEIIKPLYPVSWEVLTK